ncbi:hypothetical protein [Staphylococcus arlettae]|uniref:hypothetical protein n=1 Tax=Staphylococcus arlettae TaxID=29378 RepID=UPI0021D1D248|nr:hypothetical protein [Staphylococcus arlettae]UXU51444.1 hypothetical protein MUA71_07765 [Staphylococcus arlettae]
MNKKVQKIGENGGNYIPSMQIEKPEDLNEKIHVDNKCKRELANQKRQKDLRKAYQEKNQQL